MSEDTDHPSENERDDATFSMFAEEEASTSATPAPYQVLARKYRPKVFADLIGQEAMVRTLRNAFKLDRIAHAFMLTGVRGVGKTTTARLLARALNYQSDDHDGPSIQLEPPGEHCQAIMESRHPDILELDAASRTGVADMRELLDGVRYSPVSARYKVYIIDEVHMLSTASFNALLKTLEEPPAHVKFIFATTEIRKVPVTVLSRCQRFDLKRLDTGELAAHLGRVAAREKSDVSLEGLALIARAAEGSVRDALSILDQAIVQNVDGGEVTGALVREMLGLGDRLRLLEAFEMAISGDAKAVVAEVTDQLLNGADPLIILKDFLEIAADIATIQAVGDEHVLPGPADWTTKSRAIAARLTPAQAQRNWQILLSGYTATQSAPEPDVALRMVALRLVAAANLPSPEEAARIILENANGGGAPRAPGKPDAPVGAAPETTSFSTFDDIMARIDEAKEIRLWGEMKAYLRPGTIEFGKLTCGLVDGAPADLLRRLADFLERETDHVWDVTREDDGGETGKEREHRLRDEAISSASMHPAIKAALAALPGAKIVEVSVSEPLEEEATPDNVVPLRPLMERKG